jgi:hypothetical protein
MRSFRRSALALTLLLLAGPPAARAQADPQAGADEKTLRDAGVPVDGPGLLKFLRKQIPTPQAEKRVKELLRALGDKRFRVREQAAADLIAVGAPALGGLREAARTGDLETQRRAEQCIRAIEKQTSPQTAAAAVRLLRQRRPAGACAVLVDYLPHANDEVAEEALEAVYALGNGVTRLEGALDALFGLGAREGKVDPALAAALKDAAPARRGAAALVLGLHGTAAQRQAVRELLRDKDLTVRFRAAQGLLCSHDQGAIPVLIALLDQAPLPLAQQAEGLLNRAAGEQAPKLALEADAKVRAKCRQAWEGWWDKHQVNLDLARADLRSPFGDQASVALRSMHRFIRILDRQDPDVARKVFEVPFVIDPIMVFKTRQELEAMFAKGAGQQPKATYKVGKNLRLSEYAKLPKNFPGAPMMDVLKELPRHAEIRAILVDINQGGMQIKAAILIRVRGARATMVGIGIVELVGLK